MRQSFCFAVRSALVIGALSYALTACTLGDAYDVAKGDDPWNEDKDVRFRTTYYFRVFDECEVADRLAESEASKSEVFPFNRDRKLVLLKDSIYRFRMTGKASSLFQRVVFEAGTLKASEIDPFGATVAFDETNRQLYFKPREQVEQDARFDASLKRLQLYRDMLATTNPRDPLYNETLELVRQTLREVGGTSTVVPAFVGTPQEILALRRDAYEAALRAVKSANMVATDDHAGPPPAGVTAPVAATVITARDQTVNAGNDLQTQARVLLQRVNDDIASNSDTSAIGVVRRSGTFADGLRSDLEKTLAKAREDLRNLEKAPSPDSTKIATQKREVTALGERLSRTVAEVNRIGQAEAEIRGLLQRVVAMQVALVNRDAGLAVGSANNAGAKAEEAGCPANARLRRGFQIMGPEGVRTFNQDERLVMAMASDGKPLISLLKDLSGRILDQQKPNTAEELLPLARERLRLNEADRIVGREVPETVEQTQASIKRAIEALQRQP